MASRGREGGFTLIEVLVTMSIFSVVSIGMYMTMFSATRSSNTSRAVARVSAEARLGFNRLVRDVREGVIVCQNAPQPCVQPYAFRIKVDFDGNQIYAAPGSTNPAGDYEDLTIAFDQDQGRVTLAATGGVPRVLMEGVDCPRTSAGSCIQRLGGSPWPAIYGVAPANVFTFLSNRLEYDWNGDGIVPWQELDAAPTHSVIGVGNNNGELDGSEISLISSIGFSFAIRDGASSAAFVAEAQLRNQR